MTQLEYRRPLFLSGHILPTSSTMIGVCVTFIGLIKLGEGRGANTYVDEACALNTLVFLASAITSYASIRYAGRPRLSRRLERIADMAFLIGLVVIVGLAVVFAYEIL